MPAPVFADVGDDGLSAGEPPQPSQTHTATELTAASSSSSSTDTLRQPLKKKAKTAEDVTMMTFMAEKFAQLTNH
jgi:hypothetical protein